MNVIRTQRNFVKQLPERIRELVKSPIGNTECSSKEFLSRISDFKRTAVPVAGTYDEFVLNSGDRVVRSDYKAKNGFQLLWEKIFNPDRKLIKESFVDMFYKITMEYVPETGRIKLLEALTPQEIIKYFFD